jgi:hypothetical protein
MEEQSFLQDQGAVITSARIVINGKTFATRNVGSVGMSVAKPSRGLPIVLGIIGAGALLAQAWVVAAIFIAASAGIWWIQKPTYSLMMMAGGGEVLALQSKNAARVQQVHDAVAQAIAVR